MKKLLIVLSVCILTIAPLKGQNGINSPFSRFSIGLNDAMYNTPQAIGLGAILASGVGNQINTWNPATYGQVASRSFVFDIGVGVQMNTLSDTKSKQYDADGYVSHIAIAFPLCKWWKTAFSVQPYTDVDYSLTLSSVDTSLYGKMNTIYSGTGGANRFTWGHAFNIMGDRLALGFNLHLLYGNISQYITYDFLANDTSYFIDSQRQRNTRVLNFSTDFGLYYVQPIKEKYRLSIGLTGRPGLSQKVKESAYKYTFVNDDPRDVVYPAEDSTAEFKSTLREAWSAGLGLSFERNNRWYVAFDWEWAQWNGMKYESGLDPRVFGEDLTVYRQYNRIAMGFGWIGDPQGSHYWERVGYSVGIHYETNKLSMETAAMNEIGAGIGVKLPMRKGKSVINLAAGYSHLGQKSLMVRDCFVVGVSLGSCESWFVKRRYN